MAEWPETATAALRRNRAAANLETATFHTGRLTDSKVYDSVVAPSTRELAAAREDRIALGLPADDATILALVGSARDIGTPTWGIAMTAEEAARVDLEGRSAFVQAARRDVIPYVQPQQSFSSLYFDSVRDGELVVALTAPDPDVERAIVARMPTNSKGIRFVYHPVTEARLRSALDESQGIWNELLPDIRLLTAGVDLPNDRLFFEVGVATVEKAIAMDGQLASRLEVPVEIRAGVPAEDTTCTTRDNCVSPMKAGDRIYKGVIDSYPECTMAFHIIVYPANLDKQFLTAGHCGYSGSDNWLHPGLSGDHVIGTDQQTLYVNNGQDIMRISMYDVQASNLVYNETRPIYGYETPYVGTTVVDSRGYSDILDGGTITATYVRWYSDTAGYYVYGGTTSGITQNPGDSGSPLYERVTSTMAWAVGVVTTANGNFAVIADSIASLGPSDIYVP